MAIDYQWVYMCSAHTTSIQIHHIGKKICSCKKKKYSTTNYEILTSKFYLLQQFVNVCLSVYK